MWLGFAALIVLFFNQLVPPSHLPPSYPRPSRLASPNNESRMRPCTRDWPWHLNVTLPQTNRSCFHDGVIVTFRPRQRVCLIAKCASTFLKSAIVSVLGAVHYEGGCSSVHCARIPKVHSMRDAHVFVVVRHPVQRLLSGFLDPKGLTIAIRGERLKNVSFSAFARRVLETSPSELNPHFRHQSLQCELASPVRAFAVYYKLEHFSDWRVEFQTRFGATVQRLARPIRATRNKTLTHYRSVNLIRRVEAYFASDMQLFGYEPWS